MVTRHQRTCRHIPFYRVSNERMWCATRNQHALILFILHTSLAPSALHSQHKQMKCSRLHTTTKWIRQVLRTEMLRVLCVVLARLSIQQWFGWRERRTKEMQVEFEWSFKTVV